MLSATPQIQVLNDAATNLAYKYSDAGTPQGSYALAAANAAPRGAASLVGVEKSWVVDANRNVYIYNSATGSLLGSWSAGSMPNNATPEGIATDGTDVWIVDSRSDKVYRYAGAASRLVGSQTAASSFGGIGSNPKDIATDGVHLWIVNDGPKSDQVHKFHVTNGYWGSWTIDKANKTPTGITLDPANIGDIWISDSGTDRVYKYAAATALTGGSQTAASSFALAGGNSNAQGLVIPGRPWAETPYQVEWVRQFGSPGDDWGRGVVGDGAGNLYLSGTLVPSTDTGFLAKYDTEGNQTWLHPQTPIAGVQYGGVRVETDSLGNVFQVVGVVSGGANPKMESYDADGNLRWSTPLPVGEGMFDVAVNSSGFAYASSYEGSNVHIRKYDGATGSVVEDIVVDTGGGTNTSGIDVDALGNVYVTAYTAGSVLGPTAGSYDGLVMKFTESLTMLWSRQYGSPDADYAFAAEVDASGNVYSAGRTTGSLAGASAGALDTFMAKHDAAGNLQWLEQWGASGDEGSTNLWVDHQGYVFRSFQTTGAVAGPHLGGLDIVVAKHDPAGNLLWATQLGTSGDDAPSGGMWVDDQGNLYMGARSTGSWGATNAGGFDAVLVKLTPPAALASVSSVDAPAALQVSADSLVGLVATGTASTAAGALSSANRLDLLLAREQVFASLATQRNVVSSQGEPATSAAPKHGDADLADRSARQIATVDGAVDAAFARALCPQLWL